jgi:hypothetical protein
LSDLFFRLHQLLIQNIRMMRNSKSLLQQTEPWSFRNDFKIATLFWI